MLPRNLFYNSLFDEMEMKGMASDIYLKDGIYHVDIDVPGFDKEDINIEIHKGTLTSHIAECDVNSRKYNKLERSFYFGDIDEDSIKAEFKNGTLHLKIQKRQEETRKQINID